MKVRVIAIREKGLNSKDPNKEVVHYKSQYFEDGYGWRECREGNCLVATYNYSKERAIEWAKKFAMEHSPEIIWDGDIERDVVYILEKKYVLDKDGLTIKEAYIEPVHETFYSLGSRTIKCYNDINPDTCTRTGKFYHEEDIFSSVDEGKQGLRNYINNAIEKNQKEISRLKQREVTLCNLLNSML